MGMGRILCLNKTTGQILLWWDAYQLSLILWQERGGSTSHNQLPRVSRTYKLQLEPLYEHWSRSMVWNACKSHKEAKYVSKDYIRDPYPSKQSICSFRNISVLVDNRGENSEHHRNQNTRSKFTTRCKQTTLQTLWRNNSEILYLYIQDEDIRLMNMTRNCQWHS